MNDKILILIRGVSGSGKSTIANLLVGHSYEADQFWTEKRPFNPNLLKQAHQDCLDRVETAMERNDKKICVANTFTQEWEMKAYFELANKYNYSIVSLIAENRHGGKNIHGVPENTLQKMAKRFEIKLI